MLGRFGPYPAPHSAASGYLLQAGGKLLVMDMGAGTLARLCEQVDVREVDAVYISHLHYDHTSDLLPFRYLLEDLNKTVTVYTAREDSDWYRLLFSHPNLRVVDVSPGQTVEFGTAKLSFFEMKHTVRDLAIRIEDGKTLVYTGDTMNNPNIAAAVEGADCLLADCSKPDGFNGPHMTAPEAIALHRATGVRIISTHLSPGYSPDREYAGIDGIEVAREGVTYEI